MIDETRTLELYGYTSDELSKGSHKLIVKVCDECGKYQIIKKYLYINAKHPDLCQSCSKKGKNNLNYKKFGSDNPVYKVRVTLICEICDKKFKIIQSSNQRFCSRNCYDKWQSTNKIGKNSSNWNGGKITIKCDYCGKLKDIPLSYKHTHNFCDYKCHGKWQSENRIGENHWRWNGGKTISYCSKFNESCRESNRDKYNRKCFICGKLEKDNQQKLSVHHIDMNKEQGCNDHEWRLIPLCMSCHGMVHNLLWKNRLKYLLGDLNDKIW